MEKRTILAVLLSIVVLVAWQLIYVQPRVEEQKRLMREKQIELAKKKAEEDKQKKIEEFQNEQKKEQTPEEIKPEEIVKEPFPAKISAETSADVTVENKYFTVKFTNSGARVLSWQLKEYLDKNDKPTELVNSLMKNKGHLPLAVISPSDEELTNEVNTALFKFNSENTSKISLSEEGIKSFRLEMTYSNGKDVFLTKALTFTADSYLINMEIRAKGRLVKNSYINLGPGLEDKTKEADSTSSFGLGGNGYQAVIGNKNGETERTDKIEERVVIPWEQVNYVGVETLYFTSLYTRGENEADPEQKILITRITDKAFDEVEKKQSIVVGMEIAENTETGIFVGPKSYELSQELGLTNLIDFGFWHFLSLPLLLLLKWIYTFTHNYGFAIIIMTIMINAVFYPLRQKSYKSMAKMRELQPKINAIKNKYEKYKKDMEKRQEMNQEIMSLYRSEGASPTGGCLPLLIQFPFLIAIYKMLAVAIELRQASFMLWITDLSVKDPYYITPIVMGLTMWYQNKLNPPATGADQTTAKMMKFLPVIFTFMFLNFPAGLVLYWLINNILAIGQQYLIKRGQEQEKALQKKNPKRR